MSTAVASVETVDPATREVLAVLPPAGEVEVTPAVDAARNALPL